MSTVYIQQSYRDCIFDVMKPVYELINVRVLKLQNTCGKLICIKCMTLRLRRCAVRQPAVSCRSLNLTCTFCFSYFIYISLYYYFSEYLEKY